MKRLTYTLLGLATIGSAVFAFDDNADFKKAMMEMQPRFEKAFETKNAKFFDEISTADFSEKQGGMKFDKKQMMAQMKQNFDSAKSVKAKFKLVSTKVNGNTGVAMTTGHMVMVMKPMGPKDKEHTMVMDMWAKETWVKSGKTWKIKSLEETKPTKMTMDGKPFDPSAAGG